jgi:hypothetical protein
MSDAKRMADEANRIGEQVQSRAIRLTNFATRLWASITAATLMHINDTRGHAAVLALFDEVIAAG